MKIRILDHDYDRFVLGVGPSEQPTLVHLGTPQFVCKVSNSEHDVPPEAFIHACADGRILHSMALLVGVLNSPEDFSALMAEAESAIRQILNEREKTKYVD